MDLAILLAPSVDPAHTAACLASLVRTLPPRLTCEVVFFGQPGLTPPPQMTFHALSPSPSGNLAAARNAAVAASRAPLLCFLSPGTALLPGWLPPMLDLLHRAPLAGCIGNVHREPYSGLIDHAGLRFDAAGLPTPAGRNHALLPRETSDRHPAVSLACGLLTRALFDRLHGFDAQFHGPLGDADFCLRAAALGCRHYVANRSVVYHDAEADLSSAHNLGTADLALFHARWGARASAAHVRRSSLRSHHPAIAYSPERWEMARETRRLQRQAIRDTRRDGFTYLRKHLHRPWRYNYTRLCRALVQAFPPLPPVLPPSPSPSHQPISDLERPDDGWLFDPPPQ